MIKREEMQGKRDKKSAEMTENNADFSEAKSQKPSLCPACADAGSALINQGTGHNNAVAKKSKGAKKPVNLPHLPPLIDIQLDFGKEGITHKSVRRWQHRLEISDILNSILIGVIIFMLLIIVFLNIFILCPVRQSSMYPTIFSGQRVMLLRTKTIQNGQIFVFGTDEIDPSSGSNKNLIKRCIASGGEKLLFVGVSNGESYLRVDLYRDSGSGFVLLDESGYIREKMEFDRMALTEYCKVFKYYEGTTLDFSQAEDYVIEVPSGCFYAMGDNRNESNDSRNLGFVKKDRVIGRMCFSLQTGSLADKLLRLLYHDNEAS